MALRDMPTSGGGGAAGISRGTGAAQKGQATSAARTWRAHAGHGTSSFGWCMAAPRSVRACGARGACILPRVQPGAARAPARLPASHAIDLAVFRVVVASLLLATRE